MALELVGISKRYGSTHALHHFDAEFSNGLYGILGPNGAGKTTLVNIIVGLIAPTSGSIRYNGEDIKRLKGAFLGKIGYLPQHLGFYRNYKAYEFLRYMAVVKGLPSRQIPSLIDDALETVNLRAEKNKRLGSFSGGMIRRLGIAQALLNNPAVLVLDEPTAGLDPMERIRFRNLISRLAEERVVLLATHIVPDVEHISTEVILLGKGEKLQQASPSQLMDGIKGLVWEVSVEGEDEIQDFVRRFDIGNIVRREGCYSLRIVSGTKPCEAAISLPPSLEDVYLHYFGSRELQAGNPLPMRPVVSHGDT